MRFLILTQYFPPEVGAAQVRLASLVRELVRCGHEVEVVTALPNYPSGRILPEWRGRFQRCDRWDGIPVRRVWLHPATGSGLWRLISYLSFTLTAWCPLLRARRPDVLFVESPPLFLGLTAIAYRRWRGRRTRVLFNVADLWPDSVVRLGLMTNRRFLHLAYRLERWCYARSDGVVAVTEGLRATLTGAKRVAPERVSYLPNGVDTRLFAPGPEPADLREELGLDERPVVLYAGTHGFAHGIETALAAARLLSGRQVQFLFVGDGSEKARLTERARGMGNVVFREPMPPERIALLYRMSVAGLSTLRDNPLFAATRPAKIFAAMACARPVIYSGAGEGARLVGEVEAGPVIPPEDPAALADAVCTVLDEPARARAWGENGRRHVVSHYAWSMLVRRWLQQQRIPEHR
ncbi:MAG: glycosyltransferase family 4 protein [Planctomycetota bacterium]